MNAGTVKPGRPPPSPSGPPVSFSVLFAVVFPPGGNVNDVEYVVFVGGQEVGVVAVGVVVVGDVVPVGGNVGGKGCVVVVVVRLVVVIFAVDVGQGCDATYSGRMVCPMVGAPAMNRTLAINVAADQASRLREDAFMV
ncbi:MAG TPA: hypothetical protein VI818_06125 [Candidatus Thermoplasmatota archaeon]|nr:hypothetical protein [Candidatus Thermoplasmatota archaeon]